MAAGGNGWRLRSGPGGEFDANTNVGGNRRNTNDISLVCLLLVTVDAKWSYSWPSNPGRQAEHRGSLECKP